MAEKALTLLHLIAVMWYAMGLAAVQLPMIRAWRGEDLRLRLAALEEASHYQGAILLPGAILAGASGLFMWAQMGYNLFTTGWLVAQEALYLVTLLVCLPVIGLGLRRARLAALQAERAGRTTPELEEALADSAPIVFAGIATLLLPAMAYLAVFKPF